MDELHDQPDDRDSGELGRRDALKKLGAGAGVAWTAPVAMSFFSQAAAGTPPPTTTSSTSTSLPPEIPECRGATCETFVPCSSSNADCVCVDVPPRIGAVGGFCIPGSTQCASLTACGPGDSCTPGFVCAKNTCCQDDVCVPVSLVEYCPPDDGNRRRSSGERVLTGAGTLGG